jgi:hypothetical protein
MPSPDRLDRMLEDAAELQWQLQITPEDDERAAIQTSGDILAEGRAKIAELNRKLEEGFSEIPSE